MKYNNGPLTRVFEETLKMQLRGLNIINDTDAEAVRRDRPRRRGRDQPLLERRRADSWKWKEWRGRHLPDKQKRGSNFVLD